MNVTPVKQVSAGIGAMPASIRELGTGLLIRATSGICDRSRLNAQLAGAVAEARGYEWSTVLAMYDDDKYVRRPRRFAA
jgi:hypothetical protein